MAAVIECPECQRKLRVPEELAGTRVKCPTCNAVFDAVLSPPAPVPSITSSVPSGPFPPQSESPPAPPPLDVQVRLSLDDASSPSAPELPRPPERDEIPPLGPEESRVPAPARREERRPCPYCGEEIRGQPERCPHCEEALDAEGDDRPWERRRRRVGVRRDWEPHRGTLILVLGILSVVSSALFFLYICWIPGLLMGIVSWVMGQGDLRKMKANMMDPEGHGLTQAGWICGIIGTVLSSLMGLFCLAMLGLFGFSFYSAKNAPPPTPPPRVAPPPPRNF